MVTEEQITIQLGSYSCYVGTHFWNFQDAIRKKRTADDGDDDSSYEYRQLYRATCGGSGKQVYTPRALIIDRRLKNLFFCLVSVILNRGALGSLNPHQDDSSSANAETIDTWHGHKNTIRGDAVGKNSFRRMLEQPADEQDEYAVDGDYIQDR